MPISGSGHRAPEPFGQCLREQSRCEDGTFDELVHAGGLFGELYKLQQDL